MLTLYDTENLPIIYGWPPYTWFLHIPGSSHICGFTDVDSINLGWCSTVVFTVEKKSVHKLTCAVQTYVVQGSTVYTLCN